jgi:hypothetical protein
MAEARPMRVLGALALGVALAKELSGEAQMARAQQQACECHEPDARTPKQIYVNMTERRFNGVNRCC